MPSTYSPNKDLELQFTGENQGTWGIKTNSNLSILDLNLGGRLNISVAGSSDVVISDSQAENVYHVITGLLTGDINYKLPAAGSFYFLNNGTTGAHTLTAICFGGTGVVIPQGATVGVFVNPDTTALTALSNYIPGTSAVFLGGTTGGSANAQTLTLTTPGFTLTTGYMIVGKSGSSNTGAMTIAVNSGTAKNVYKVGRSGAVALNGGDFQSGQMFAMLYDGTEWQLLDPAIEPPIVFGGGTTGGSADAQTLTVTTAGFALTAGYAVTGIAGFSNTTAMTLAVNSGTAKNVYKVTRSGVAALGANDLQSGQAFAMVYDGTEWVLLDPALGTAAFLNVGVSANNIVQLNGSGQLPAVDGSLLTNLPTTNSFTSAGQTYSATALLTIAHGLGSTPKTLQIWGVCTSSDAGYSTNDIAFYNQFAADNNNAGDPSHGFCVVPDATNINVRCGQTPPTLIAYSNGTQVTTNQSKWQWYFHVTL